jgi:hypothetical protein
VTRVPCLSSSAGYHQPAEAASRCEPCSAGKYQAEGGKEDCVPCRVDQDSAQGSALCTACPASECASCGSIPGVSCRTNATVAVLILHEGVWRHSTTTTQTWRCKTSGSWSPCRGGVDAGEDGNGCKMHPIRNPPTKRSRMFCHLAHPFVLQIATQYTMAHDASFVRGTTTLRSSTRDATIVATSECEHSLLYALCSSSSLLPLLLCEPQPLGTDQGREPSTLCLEEFAALSLSGEGPECGTK